MNEHNEKDVRFWKLPDDQKIPHSQEFADTIVIGLEGHLKTLPSADARELIGMAIYAIKNSIPITEHEGGN